MSILDELQDNDDKYGILNNINNGFILGNNNGLDKPILSYVKDNKIVTDTNYSTPTTSFSSNSVYGTRFRGFYKLALLVEDPIISGFIIVLSNDMIKSFGEVVYIGDDDPEKELDIQDKITTINKRLNELNIKSVLEKAIRTTLLMGGCGIFIEINNDDSSNRLEETLAGKLNKLTNDMITNLKIVDPMYMVPIEYNVDNPLSKKYYNPQIWQVYANKVHKSRIPQMIFQEVPNFLKPMYNFQGISMAQKLEPLVNDFYSVKSNIVKITKRMRTFVILTNLQALLNVNCTDAEKESFVKRIKQLKDGDTLIHLLLDKDSEDFKDISSNISGLGDLLSIFADQICVATQIPVSKVWGQSPKGLNSTGEGDLKNYYDVVTGNQRNMVYHIIKYIIDLISIEQFGDVIDGIDFEFNPIQVSSNKEIAEISSLKAQEYISYMGSGVLSADEVRNLLSKSSNEFSLLETGDDDLDAEIRDLFDNIGKEDEQAQ